MNNQKLYYVVKKELHQLDPNVDVEETTGYKMITLYDIDTQCMDIIELYQTIVSNMENSEDILQEWLEENDYRNINLVEL